MNGPDSSRKPLVDAEAIRRAASGERQLPRRFYDAVAVVDSGTGFAVELDGRPLRTPLRALLDLPTRALGEAVAAEWLAQEDRVDPATMPVTRLANTAIDRVAPRVGEIVAEVTSYAQSDLLCYRAESPDGLVLRQAQHWDPILRQLEKEIGGRFILIQGVIHQVQPEETIGGFRRRVEGHEPFVLTALHNMMTLTGSALLAEAVVARFVAAEDAWSAAHVDEDWQIEQWGEDHEAAARRAARRAEFDVSARFAELAAQ